MDEQPQDHHCDPRNFEVEQRAKRKWLSNQMDPQNNNQKGPEPQVVSKAVVPPKIWIIGASQIKGAKPVAFKKYGANFGLNARVSWFGRGGMGWAGVLHRFYKELSFQNSPDILVIHAGGNDLGLVDPYHLVYDMNMDLRKLRRDFPQMKIIFSCLHERRSWRYENNCRMNRVRKLVNGQLRRVLKKLRCDIVEHPNIRFFYKGVFVADGVHFTEFGNEIFLSNIRQVIEKVLEKTLDQRQTRTSTIQPKRYQNKTKLAHYPHIDNDNQ